MEEMIGFIEKTIPEQYISNFMNKLEDESVQSRMEDKELWNSQMEGNIENKEYVVIKTNNKLEIAMQALRDIVDPISRIKKNMGLGYKIEGITAVKISNDATYLRDIAKTALKEIDVENNKWDNRVRMLSGVNEIQEKE